MADGARLIAVLDVGKTNVKLVVHDLERAADVFVRARPNRVVDEPPYPHFDTEAIWAFFLSALRDAAAAHAIEAISVTTHGASVVLLSGGDLALPVLDYECLAPDSLSAAYDSLRPPFAESFSPRLPGGLNVGAQLHWQSRTFPEAFARVTTLLPYPQYWAYRLSGVLASEATSLGCHTDLWAPQLGGFSSLARSQGWDRLFAPLRSAFDVLGPVTSEVAAATGLAPTTPVLCGIHDSNASLLPHLMARPAPFSVLSTGTWVIAFAVGGALDGLDPQRDGLSNVDAYGRPVPSARFMGGREFEILSSGSPVIASAEECRAALRGNAMVLPTLTPGSGPFPSHKGGWTLDPSTLPPGERAAVISLYLALVAQETLTVAGADGPIIVEGPFGGNDLFVQALAHLTGRPVEIATGTTGTSTGAAILALGPDHAAAVEIDRRALITYPLDPLAGYARRWRQAIGGTV